MPSSSGTASLPVDSRSNTASATGNIISVVAVLEIHMLQPAVASMKASRIRRPLPPPTTENIDRAICRWAPVCSAALESMKPPMNNRISQSPYEPATSLWSSTPTIGNRAKGTSEVAGMGIDSNNHQTAHKVVMATVQHCGLDSPACRERAYRAAANATPPTVEPGRVELVREKIVTMAHGTRPRRGWQPPIHAINGS